VGASGTSGIATPLLVMPDVLARLILAMLPIVSYGCWKNWLSAKNVIKNVVMLVGSHLTCPKANS
jgi:hypothetical protein